jgi:HK97 family phage major capsid protein
MAQTAATSLGGFAAGFLPPRMAAPIFERAGRTSVVQRLVRQVPLGITGETIPVVTGRARAGWVGEAQAKPTTSTGVALKTITPHKLAAISVVSAEVVRANPGNYMTVLRDQIGESFGLAFDLAALHDQGPDGTAGAGPFPTFLDQTTKSVALGSSTTTEGGIHQDFVDAMRLLVRDADASGRRYRLTGYALDSVMEPELWGAVDAAGKPIYVNLPTDDVSAAITPGNLMGRPSFMGEGVAGGGALDINGIVGYAADWSQMAWGVVGGISYDVSTEATVTLNGELVSLWENNLVAIRAEAEYGFLLNDPDAVVELTNDVFTISA